MKVPFFLSAAAMLLLGTGANAQDTSPPPPPHDMGPDQPIEEVPVPPGPQASEEQIYSDTEVRSFAAAALRMRALRSDPDLDQAALQAAAEAILMEEGLSPETFSAMQSAAQSDPALATRIQMAIEASAANEESR